VLELLGIDLVVDPAHPAVGGELERHHRVGSPVEREDQPDTAVHVDEACLVSEAEHPLPVVGEEARDAIAAHHRPAGCVAIGATVAELDDVGREEVHETFDVAVGGGHEQLLDHAALVFGVGPTRLDSLVFELPSRATRQLAAGVR